MALTFSPPTHRFGTSRIPVKPSDSFNKYPREQAEHVIVLRKNRFFKLDTRGRGAREIEAALEQIKQTVGEQEGLAVGALTSENRDVWAEVSRTWAEGACRSDTATTAGRTGNTSSSWTA